MKKSQKRFDGEQEKSMAASFDRFPDDILIHILSFMSTEDCVRSSILGKRWRFLWVRVPNLEFDSDDHETMRGFSNFLIRFVFIHKGQNIKKIRLVNQKKENELDFETLIAAAIACNVQVIEITSDFSIRLPQSIFTCKTLVDLRLLCFLENNDPMTGTTVFLPALKRLELQMGISEESLVHLLSGCPVLEELTILKIDSNVVCFYVSSPTISRLDLDIQFDDINGHDKVFELKLDTPALEHLKLHDCLSRDFSTGILAFLTEADVVFDAQTDSDVLYSRSVLEFVGKLNNVNYLQLTTRWNCMEVPDSAFTIKFHNLTKLVLIGDLRFVTIFLENSDNLEVLTVRMDGYLQYWREPKQVPLCLTYHLGKVRFFNFKFLEHEFDLVKYILRNAKVLKTMEIRVSYAVDDVKEKYEALQRISKFERACEACQLAFD